MATLAASHLWPERRHGSVIRVGVHVYRRVVAASPALDIERPGAETAHVTQRHRFGRRVHDRAYPAARPLLTAISFLTSVPNSTAAASIVVGVARHDQAEPPCPGCRSIDVPGVPPHRRRVLVVVVGGIHGQYYRPASRDLAMWQITGTLAECTRRRWGTQQALALPTTTRTRTNNSYHNVRAKTASTATSVSSQWPARALTIAHSTSATSPTTINVTLKRAIYAAPHSHRRPRRNMAIS
jgi:hypothetical protein